jgi:ferritin-like protein
MACAAYERLLRYFEYGHLPPPLRAVSESFSMLAVQLMLMLPDNHAEVTVCLRKILEAKDCAVRAALDLPPAPQGKE